MSWWLDVVEVWAGGVRLWRLELGLRGACISGERWWRRLELVARGGGGGLGRRRLVVEVCAGGER